MIMKSFVLVLATILGILASGPVWANPPSREESDRRAELISQLKKSLGAEASAAGKVALGTRVMNDEPDPNVRGLALHAAAQCPGNDLDTFLTGGMAGD